MTRVLRAIGRWIGLRFELEDSVGAVITHPVPASLEGRVGWWYVFGSATLTMFIVQVVTGVGLAMTYVPAPNSAYDSLQFISTQATLGGVVRGIHYFGAGAMVVLVLVHMTQVFLFGSYKFPREANWMSGSLLLLLTFAMAFTGQLLRWDQDAFWSIVVAAEQAARAPIVGGFLATLVVAGQNVGGATLTRFYATHVFLIPAAIVGLLGVHLYLVIKRGISEPPVPGERVNPRTYLARYRELLARGIPFYPDAAVRDAVVSFVAVVVVIALAVVAGAPMLGKPPDPTIIVADPRPDWYFIGYFALLAIIPKGLESVVIIGLPALAFGFLFLLPLIRPRGERHVSRRPMAVAAVGLGVLVYGALTFAGFASPWVPVSTEGASLPPAVLSGLTASEAAGARLFIETDCFACHQVGGAGGRRGPDLSAVGARLTRDQLVTVILGGKGQSMPSFASALTPAELADLVAFLGTRR
ncbi:MAG: ubiquinol-cytochrome c reductase cytochrome b subunit [Chloroflexota bacterium]|nr:ubiquinol-cytochrome c reductase cytochrome b subunit [Chloroflexota bacterium]